MLPPVLTTNWLSLCNSKESPESTYWIYAFWLPPCVNCKYGLPVAAPATVNMLVAVTFPAKVALPELSIENFSVVPILN